MVLKYLDIVLCSIFVLLGAGLEGHPIIFLWSISGIFLLYKYINKLSILEYSKLIIFLYWTGIIIVYQLLDINWQVVDVDSDGHMMYVLDSKIGDVVNQLIGIVRDRDLWDIRLIVGYIWKIVSLIYQTFTDTIFTTQTAQRFLILKINIFFQLLNAFNYIEIIKELKIKIAKKKLFIIIVFIGLCNPGYLYYVGYVSKESLLSLAVSTSLLSLLRIYLLYREYINIDIKNNRIFTNKKFIFNLTILVLSVIIGTLARPYYPFLVISGFYSMLYFLKIKKLKWFNKFGLYCLSLIILVGFFALSKSFLVYWIANSTGIILTPNLFRISNYQNYFFQTTTSLILTLSLMHLVLRTRFRNALDLILSILISGACFGIAITYYKVSIGENIITNLAFFLPRTRLCLYQGIAFFGLFAAFRISQTKQIQNYNVKYK